MMDRTTRQGTFDRIYKEYYSRLFYFAFNMLRDTDLCKDILEDVFLILWNRIDTVGEINVRSYLFASVRNKIIDNLRHDERHRNYSEEYMRQASIYYTDYTEELKKDRLVEKMITQLHPPTDHILEMCYLQKMKYHEVAQALGISPNTVKKHNTKALKLLRSLYNGEKDTYLD